MYSPKKINLKYRLCSIGRYTGGMGFLALWFENDKLDSILFSSILFSVSLLLWVYCKSFQEDFLIRSGYCKNYKKD